MIQGLGRLQFAATLALIGALFIMPSAIALAWKLANFGLTPAAGLVPVEILAVFLPAWLVSNGPKQATVLRWRRSRALTPVWAGLGAVGLAGLLTYLQKYWEQLTGLRMASGIAEILTIRSYADLAWLTGGAVLLPSVCEETAFRGFIQSRLEVWGPAFAITITTALFALFHFDLYGMPTYLALGAYLGFVAWRGNSLWPAVVAHGLNNAIALAQLNGLPEAWWWVNAGWIVPASIGLALVGIAGVGLKK